MKEAVLKNLDEETVKVLSTKLKVWQKFDMLSNPCKSSLILESDTCRTEIPLNPDGSVKWFDDSKLVRHKEPENQKEDKRGDLLLTNKKLIIWIMLIR